jgi:hypothetical protein
MNKFINSLCNKYDVQIPFSTEPEKGQNSYSLDKSGNIEALFLNDLSIQNLDILLPIADKLEVLSLNNCSIEQISYPHAFSNLKKLCLVDNPIEQSALKNLIQLQSLIELELRLVDISDSSPLGELTNLTRLDLGFNLGLYDVKGLKKLKSLKHLDLQFSRIDNISKIEVNENIQTMDLNSGRITQISGLESYLNLRSLDMSGSAISKMEGLDHLKKLIRLSLAVNSIDKIEGLSNLANLEILDLSMNEINKIENMESLVNLKELNLRDNKISAVENLDSLLNLEHLILDENKISGFDSKFLNSLNSQCYISLAGNPMKQLEGNIPENVTIEFETDHTAPRFL